MPIGYIFQVSDTYAKSDARTKVLIALPQSVLNDDDNAGRWCGNGAINGTWGNWVQLQHQLLVPSFPFNSICDSYRIAVCVLGSYENVPAFLEATLANVNTLKGISGYLIQRVEVNTMTDVVIPLADQVRRELPLSLQDVSN